MSPYYATHAGMLKCVAREFTDLARTDAKDGKRFAMYAQVLERMIADLAVKTPPAV